MRIERSVALVFLLALSTTSTQAETLIGDNVTVKSDTTLDTDPTITSVTVGPGQELTNFASLWNIDIGSDSVEIRFSQWFGLRSVKQGLLFSDLDWSPIPQTITGFSVETSKAAFDPDRVTLGPDSFYVDFAGDRGYKDGDYGDWYTSDYVTIHLQTVPEPSALVALAGMVLVGCVIARRRPKQ
jgi:hypothetical protein